MLDLSVYGQTCVSRMTAGSGWLFGQAGCTWALHLPYYVWRAKRRGGSALLLPHSDDQRAGGFCNTSTVVLMVQDFTLCLYDF